jgi:hypothetical protein
MPAERTFVSEVATGLGMLGHADLDSVLADRPAEMSNLTPEHWDELVAIWRAGKHRPDFVAGFINGQRFLTAPDALNGRRPRIIEWTGGRRSPGDEVVPSDLRVDHVYLISCRDLSRILHNPSPARLVEGLLTHAPVEDLSDWYHRVAPDEYQKLFEACAPSVEGSPLPERATDLAKTERRRLAVALRAGWPAGASEAYAALCRSVSERTAYAWSARITSQTAEAVLWPIQCCPSSLDLVGGHDHDAGVLEEETHRVACSQIRSYDMDTTAMDRRSGHAEERFPLRIDERPNIVLHPPIMASGGPTPSTHTPVHHPPYRRVNHARAQRVDQRQGRRAPSEAPRGPHPQRSHRHRGDVRRLSDLFAITAATAQPRSSPSRANATSPT